MNRLGALFAVAVLAANGCKKSDEKPAPSSAPGAATAPTAGKKLKIGLVSDIGGRGDHSFNDSALRGLELWAGGVKLSGSSYVPASADEVRASLPADLVGKVAPFGVQPVVLQSKAQEDYEPNLQLVVDQNVDLAVATGFMLENAVETVAKRNPSAKFLLIDSPLLDSTGKPFTLPNVRSVVFREEEGSFLVGAIAGLVTKTGKVGFVGGMEIPLIKKFEAGFRAGVQTVNPKAAVELISNYTGSFDNVGAGKQIAQDLVAKGADVVFHAAGTDGLGVIQAVKEARAAGKDVYVIGVDSDQSALAPEAVLTSMLKRVDYAVYQTARDLADGKWSAGNHALGLAEGGVTYADVRVAIPKKQEVLDRVEALRKRIIAGEIKVPSNATELSAFKAAP